MGGFGVPKPPVSLRLGKGEMGDLFDSKHPFPQRRSLAVFGHRRHFSWAKPLQILTEVRGNSGRKASGEDKTTSCTLSSHLWVVCGEI